MSLLQVFKINSQDFGNQIQQQIYTQVFLLILKKVTNYNKQINVSRLFNNALFLFIQVLEFVKNFVLKKSLIILNNQKILKRNFAWYLMSFKVTLLTLNIHLNFTSSNFTLNLFIGIVFGLELTILIIKKLEKHL